MAKTKKATAAATRVETQSDINSSVLLCIVSDIRGFTTLTERVDNSVRSGLIPPNKGNEIMKAYIKYVDRTQTLARNILIKNLKDHPYAIKATGDGYLVAIEVCDSKDLLHDKHQYTDEAKSMIYSQIIQLTELVDSAYEVSADENKEFGNLTYQFIQVHGSAIGINPKWVTDEGSLLFRIAGAATLGLGILQPGHEEQAAVLENLADAAEGLTEAAKYLPIEQKSLATKLKRVARKAKKISKEAEEKTVSYGDAFGHTVNLTFRICNEAGRSRRDAPTKVSPMILLDRRVASVLLEKLSQQKCHDRKVKTYEIYPYGGFTDMKGIEERWCYAMVTKRQMKHVGHFITHHEIG